jgi:hypothetical protein
MKLPLQEFVKRTIEEITAELPPNYSVNDNINFDVSFLIDVDDADDLQLIAITDELGREKKSLHRVSFSVSKKGFGLPAKVGSSIFAKSETKD